MKVYEFSPFYNENQILKLKHSESKVWVDKLFVTESNCDFKKNRKEYYCDEGGLSKVEHLKLNGIEEFKEKRFGLSRRYPYLKFKNNGWVNERIQRDSQVELSGINVEDGDILVFSDVDEIIDSRNAEYLIDMVKIMGIVTVKLRFYCYYFNLLSENWHEVWPGSPPDYSYRVFLMTGRHYKKLKGRVDQLRKKGEGGRLYNEVACFPFYSGFHYSWMGGAEAVKSKLKAYAHDLDDHDRSVVNAYNQEDFERYIVDMLKNGGSLFPNHRLVVEDVEKMPKLNMVDHFYTQNRELFLV